MKKILSKKDEKDACELYKLGKTQNAISKIYNCSRTTIVKCLKDNGIKTRTANHWAKRYDIDESFFECVDSQKKAYILGMLFADGNVQKYEISLQLSENDFDILNEINYIFYKNQKKLEKCKARGRTKPSYRLRIVNKKMADDLKKLGCVENKSLILKFPNHIDEIYLPHFIRGVFDGDGHIKNRKGKGYVLVITGSDDFCEQLSKKMNKTLNINFKISKTGNVSSTRLYSKRHITKFCNYMYEKSEIHMKRKYMEFKSF